MSEYDNNNSGMMARNDRREKETHPEFTGSVTVDGVEYWLSAWVKIGKEGSKMAGRKFFSLAFKPKNPPPAEDKPRADAMAGITGMSDDIPF